MPGEGKRFHGGGHVETDPQRARKLPNGPTGGRSESPEWFRSRQQHRGGGERWAWALMMTERLNGVPQIHTYLGPQSMSWFGNGAFERRDYVKMEPYEVRMNPMTDKSKETGVGHHRQGGRLGCCCRTRCPGQPGAPDADEAGRAPSQSL